MKTLRRNWVSYCLSPLKHGKNFFQKRLFMGGHIVCQFSWAKLLIDALMETSETWGVTLTRRQACWRGFPGRMGVGWNYLWCLVILIFMRLGSAKRLRGRGGLRIGPIFIRGRGRGEVDTSRKHGSDKLLLRVQHHFNFKDTT